MVLQEKDQFDGGRKLPVMEEFYTIQGEGYHMGTAAYFVRIGGCDVGCSWCDTKESWDSELFPAIKLNGIIEHVASTPAKTIVVTGGEPSMYPLDYFTKKLQEKGVKTMVETSGAKPLTGVWDWVCLSPKKYSPPHSSVYPKANELKVIIQNAADIVWAEKNAALVSKDCKLFLQPEWSRAEAIMETLTDYVMQHPEWKISLQAHKYMKIP
jgi:organic radical activating enzyme